ncbi:MAG TPA: hypothetical protein VFN30_03715 [Chitinophagaceae bacterium]|nr:hypothetical protein [Chitinophagaceae bacterium]
MSPLRKISGLLLLLLAAIPMVYSIVFLFQQHSIRQNMLEKLKREHLDQITLAKTDFVWTKKGAEIRIGKDLFDVKEWVEVNGKIIVKGRYDHKEKQLYKQLEEMANSGRQKSQIFLIKFFTQLVCIRSSLLEHLLPGSITINNYFKTYVEAIFDRSIPVFTPPPQFS